MGYNPSYKWINPTYPIYNWGYNPLTKWDEPPSNSIARCNPGTTIWLAEANFRTEVFFLDHVKTRISNPFVVLIDSLQSRESF